MSFLISGLIWFLPIDVVQNWAYERADADEFRRFEAMGHVEFVCWFLRFASPLLFIAACIVWRNSSRAVMFMTETWNGFLIATRVMPDGIAVSRWRTAIVRTSLIAWGVLAVTHFTHAFQQRMRDWPYYRFRSGAQILPNISDSNRDVIRYLQQVTPESSRIFVVSDQKLFFLSYYLLPRRIYHKTHPESEHVIPLAHQQRKLPTYLLEDLPADELARLHPDYILEYFEHPDYVERHQRRADPNWVDFARKSRGDPGYTPQYFLRLRMFSELESR